MFSKLKMKLAAKRMQRQKDFAAADKRIRKNDSKLKRIVLWPFRMIGRVLRWIWDVICAICAWVWEWLCGINIVGLINLTLLLAIIILFSMLILDVVRCRRGNVVAAGPAKNVEVVATKYNKNIPLPMRRDAKTGDMPAPVHVVKVAESQNPAIKPMGDGNIYGDVVIESRAESRVLKNGAHIRGNLYLQRMRKYVLPCGVVVEGNLFLRDVNMLQFCGPFTVTGNIYVSPRSSFGPIPYNARLGGQVIL